MTAPKKKAAPEAYIIKMDGAADLMGLNKAVKFVHGHGVLDKNSLAEARPDMVDLNTGNPKDASLLPEIAAFWARQGADVEEVTQAKADAYRKKLAEDPRGHLPKPKAPKAVKPKEEGTEGDGKKPASKKPAGGGTTPPHQQPKE
jgi:hypothetical protein